MLSGYSLDLTRLLCSVPAFKVLILTNFNLLTPPNKVSFNSSQGLEDNLQLKVSGYWLQCLSIQGLIINHLNKIAKYVYLNYFMISLIIVNFVVYKRTLFDVQIII